MRGEAVGRTGARAKRTTAAPPAPGFTSETTEICPLAARSSHSVVWDAWEQGRAAASGRSAVEVVERQVEIPTPLTPTRRDWGPLLAELARQLEDGRIYERDLTALGAALGGVLEAYHRRPSVRDRSHSEVLPHLR